jgi:hypothetical protein
MSSIHFICFTVAAVPVPSYQTKVYIPRNFDTFNFVKQRVSFSGRAPRRGVAVDKKERLGENGKFYHKNSLVNQIGFKVRERIIFRKSMRYESSKTSRGGRERRSASFSKPFRFQGRKAIII